MPSLHFCTIECTNTQHLVIRSLSFNYSVEYYRDMKFFNGISLQLIDPEGKFQGKFNKFPPLRHDLPSNLLLQSK